MDSSFRKIYTEYKHQVFFFVKKYIHGRDDIEDVVQDIFVHLWKHRHSLNDTNLSAAVFKTAKQEISNFYRKNKLSFSTLEENTCTAKDESNEEIPVSHIKQIEDLLFLIPEKSKSFFLKHKVDGLSYSQIAKENSISKNAVAKHVNKVLLFLRTNLSSFF
ncbi:sigma-70 family RNA polymerase sigma factor [Elizabethkingia sp. HX WHF]|uniref:RNA polymerase sigma factor n=1 Tax=Elizabethkingia TaxID=308865 RepID=UPI0012FDA069|nr:MULTISPECIES: sigma-70 family RNA polymerase sigma factor [Elizabethkingia]MCL1636707.1 sigma-70 family RNA polymerase sigma factor [Elizabethkingia bruuniana]MDX8564034.1 sigma-70 family RNA polymerase sigma factor [Elizabethkingia sp. HX WHF]